MKKSQHRCFQTTEKVLVVLKFSGHLLNKCNVQKQIKNQTIAAGCPESQCGAGTSLGLSAAGTTSAASQEVKFPVSRGASKKKVALH